MAVRRNVSMVTHHVLVTFMSTNKIFCIFSQPTSTVCSGQMSTIERLIVLFQGSGSQLAFTCSKVTIKTPVDVILLFLLLRLFPKNSLRGVFKNLSNIYNKSWFIIINILFSFDINSIYSKFCTDNYAWYILK